MPDLCNLSEFLLESLSLVSPGRRLFENVEASEAPSLAIDYEEIALIN
jgi:hypothetical protein